MQALDIPFDHTLKGQFTIMRGQKRKIEILP
jgi:hypothetical protein